MTIVLAGLFLIFLIFLLVPIIIGRLANFAGRYRLIVMVALILVGWSLAILVINYFVLFRGDIGSAAIGPATLGIVIALIVPLYVGGRLLARLIARRYAPSVADALASVIIGSTASFVAIVVGLYFSFTYVLTSFQNTFPTRPSAEPIPLVIMIPVLGLTMSITASVAWILMGWGSMPTLRRRKGTVMGLVCAGIAVVFSIVLTLVVSQISQILLSASASVHDAFVIAVVLQVIGAFGIIAGMLVAGYMHGILTGLASISDFAAFIVMVALLMTVFSINPNRSGLTSSESIRFLVLIVALSVVYIRAVLIGHPIVSMFGFVLMAIPFIGLFPRLPWNTLQPLMFALGSIVLLFWLRRWGLALRQMRYGGQISTVLMIAALIVVPLVYVLS